MGRYAVPIVGFFVGCGFVLALLYAIITTPFERAVPTVTEEFHKEPKAIAYSFSGPFGKYDRKQLQRGFQVYKEVCSACHSLKLVAFRDLEQLGFNKAEVKALAKGWATQVPDVNPQTGEAASRPGLPSDHIPSPFLNDVQARAANNNALPPDLSLMAKAREGGPAYIASLVTGYADQPGYKNEKGEELLKKFPDAKTPDILHFNPYFANLNIAMPPPLVSEGQVTFADGTKSTVDQMGKDVSAFLMWAAEPKLEARHQWGVTALIYLLLTTGLAYGAYRSIWRGKKN